MTVFLSTLSQMAYLLLLIAAGYLLCRFGAVTPGAAGVLSKLENCLFIPALCIGTFMTNFTPEKFATAGIYLLGGALVAGVSIPLALLLARLCSRDDYIRKIYTYGLSFSNFGFMGNAVVSALYPEIFMEYLVFVTPLWIMIYLWGVPALLIPAAGERKSMTGRLKPLANPMFAGMIIGILLGLTGLQLPAFAGSAVTVLGNCMSPLAMLLTGITIAGIDLKKTLAIRSIYALTAIRLVLIPLLMLGALLVLRPERGVALCALCAVAMPLGLNTVVVPAAYGRDTSVAAGMALVSHPASCLTIPLIFMLFNVFYI